MKTKIVNGEYVDFALLLEKCEFRDNNDKKGKALSVNNLGQVVGKRLNQNVLFRLFIAGQVLFCVIRQCMWVLIHIGLKNYLSMRT